MYEEDISLEFWLKQVAGPDSKLWKVAAYQVPSLNVRTPTKWKKMKLHVMWLHSVIHKPYDKYHRELMVSFCLPQT